MRASHTDFLVTFSALFYYAYSDRVAKALRNHVQPLSKDLKKLTTQKKSQNPDRVGRASPQHTAFSSFKIFSCIKKISDAHSLVEERDSNLEAKFTMWGTKIGRKKGEISLRRRREREALCLRSRSQWRNICTLVEACVCVRI